MTAQDVTPLLDDVRADVVNAVADAYIPPQTPEEVWNLAGLEETLERDFELKEPVRAWVEADKQLDDKGIRGRVLESLAAAYARKKAGNEERLGQVEKVITLQILDQFWREHLAAIDYLRQGIHLRGYAQKDPKQEYKREAFSMFNEMLARFKHAVISNLARVRILTEAEVAAMEEARRAPRPMQAVHAEAEAVAEVDGAATEPVPASRPLPAAPPAPVQAETFVREMPKVGRNDPCPCGSGKKFKQCHGKLA
jgi:preprotein translocase subunit SecA